MERVSWIKNNSIFKRVDGDITNVEKVPVGVYNVNFSQNEGWFLTKTGDKFEFDYKLYGLQSSFIERVVKVYHSTSGNMGILFNGVRGTGKTVTAKVLANKLEMPIVMAKSFSDDDNTALMEYISSFNFDCIIFFDEFEKTFKNNDCSILKIMDGALQSKYRRVFLLTTNETHINENMLSRPSRIRYVKEFGNLEESIVREYLYDTLEDKTKIDDIVDFVDTLEISTIDILKTIVEDINVFGFDDFFANKDVFNVKTANYYYETINSRMEKDDSSNYDMGMFIKDSSTIASTKVPNRHLLSDQQYEKAMNAYRKKMPNIVYSESDIRSNKSIKTIKPGDKFGRYMSEVVIDVDRDACVIKTIDTDDNYITYYYIKNPGNKPSLYSCERTYGYDPCRCQCAEMYDDVEY